MHSLPLIETRSPTTAAELAAALAEAHVQGAAVYPLGGATSLEYGGAPARPGIGLSLAQLNRVIDYPARDMTVTVEAGITLAELAQRLAAERPWLPCAGAEPERATLGGLVATGWNGSRRYGWGALRDYVIGVTAVDGRGQMFHGGGRVVKNVAGYDFCKLLTGSLGSLGVITQLTLKLKPMPERSSLLVISFADLDAAERLLARLVSTATAPSAIDLLVGPVWREEPAAPPLAAGAMGRLVVGLDGSEAEVAWMERTLAAEWRELATEPACLVVDEAATRLWDRLRDFAVGPPALAIRASVTPSRVCEFIASCLRIFPQANIQSHAGNGIALALLGPTSLEVGGGASEDLRQRVAELRRAAGGGHISLLASGAAGPLGSEEFWGPVGPSLEWMRRVKKQFDPENLLNPGRFVFA